MICKVNFQGLHETGGTKNLVLPRSMFGTAVNQDKDGDKTVSAHAKKVIEAGLAAFWRTSHAEHWISFNMDGTTGMIRNDQQIMHVIDTRLTMRFQLILLSTDETKGPRTAGLVILGLPTMITQRHNACQADTLEFHAYAEAQMLELGHFLSPLPSLLEMESCQDASGDIVDRCHGYPPCYLGLHPRSTECLNDPQKIIYPLVI